MSAHAIEKVNEEGAIETKAETVDYRSSAGQEPTKDKVGVVHLRRNKKDSSSGGGILAGAAAALTKTVKSAKDGILGRGKDNTK